MILYTIIFGYFVLFWWQVFKDPYSIATAEALDQDFPVMRLCGEYWRKGKRPKDPVFYKHLTGIRPGVFYPVNIFFSWLGSFFDIDKGWILYVINLLLHQLAVPLMAYHLFGGGLEGLFGAIAWGFISYHIKTTLWYAQTFTWITATILLMDTAHPLLAGVALGILVLCGHPPFVVYFGYGLVAWMLLWGKFPFITFVIAFLIGFIQIFHYYKYKKFNITSQYTLQEKVEIGQLPIWSYLFMFLPVRFRYYIGKVGHEEWCFYVGPLVGFFALFGRGSCWLLIVVCILLSLGRGVYGFFHRFCSRMPYRIGYFAALGCVVLAVEGIKGFGLNTQQLVLLNILLAVTMWFSRDFIILPPFYGYGEKPSKVFGTPLLKYLEKNSGGHRVNNLPFPVYPGIINHLNVPGYTGGNHMASLGKFLGVTKMGHCPYNWFYWQEDGVVLDAFDIGWHIGERPVDNKWKPTPFANLWRNENVVDFRESY